MIEKQKQEREQIQAKMQELNASTNIQTIKTVYQSSIADIKQRMDMRKMFADEVRKGNKEKFGNGGGEDEEEGGSEDDGKDKGDRDVPPPVDMRKKRAEKEYEEFQPYFDLKLNNKHDEDMKEFKKISQYWDEGKIKRFHNMRLKYQMRQFEKKNGLARDEDKRSSSKLPTYKPMTAPEWLSDSSVYPKPIGVGKNGKPIFNKEELEKWQKEQKELQAKIQARRDALKKKQLTPAQEKELKEERKKAYDKMIKEMRNE